VISALLALVSAVLLILIFPRWNITLLAPVALTPLLIALAGESRPIRRFLLGWTAGIVYWFGVCYWIQFVLALHGGVGNAAAWAMFLLFTITKALHLGIFGLVAGILMRRWWAAPAVAAWWVTEEVTHGPLGFAWLALGNAGIDMGIPMRLAPFTGVYGLSFIFALLSAALALAVLRRPRKELLWIAPLPLIALLPAMPAAERGRDAALLVQPNISETEDWTTESVDRMQRRLAAVSLRGALADPSSPPSIVAWPEVPAPLYYEDDPRFRSYVNNLAHTLNAYLLVGEVAHAPSGAPLNSALLVSPDGTSVSRYD